MNIKDLPPTTKTLWFRSFYEAAVTEIEEGWRVVESIAIGQFDLLVLLEKGAENEGARNSL